jgi:hypothetical protein
MRVGRLYQYEPIYQVLNKYGWWIKSTGRLDRCARFTQQAFLRESVRWEAAIRTINIDLELPMNEVK